MNRLIDFTLSDEESVVSRILVQVHKSVDRHFPSAEAATRQFTKTVFSEDDSESTAMLKVPNGDSQFGAEESTEQTDIEALTAGDTQESGLNSFSETNSNEQLSNQKKTDWVSSLVMVLLLAGLIMLAYILYFL
jgi:hypothetical protein